jgi:hypothetical protein
MTAIKGNEIIQDGLFDNAAKSAKELVGVLDLVEKELQDIAETQNKIAQDSGTKDFKSLQAKTKAINEVRKATDQLTKIEISRAKLEKEQQRAAQQKLKTEQQSIKTTQENIKVTQQQEKAKQGKIRTTQLEAREAARLAKIQIKASKAIEANTNAYKTLSTQTNKAQAKFKKLAAQFGVTSKQARKAKAEFATLDNKLRKVNDAARDGRRDVGRYSTAFKGLGASIKRGLGALGLIAGVAALGRGIKNTISIFSGFQQGAANLAAVLGKSRGEIKALTNDAKRLGASTAFTAKQVTQLQTEFAKLGFSEKEIIAATEATLDLAAATGTDLAEAAAVAGATLGGFGLEADETQRIVDVMAKSFSTSALDMEKFKESMKTAAPAARAVGISVEKTTALLGTMANAGIAGSKAGNNLKTSLINLNEAGLTLEQGLAKVNKSTDKLGAATKLVGKNAAASFLVLAKGTETTKELTEGLNNAGGAARKMADEQLDTLSGATTRLSSAWEGFVLSLEDGDGVISRVLRGAIDLTTEFLGKLGDLAKSEDQLRKSRLKGNRALGEESTQRLLIEEQIIALQQESNKELQKIVDSGGVVAAKIAKTIIALRAKGTSELQNQLIITDAIATKAEETSKRTTKDLEDRIAAGKVLNITEEEFKNQNREFGRTEALQAHRTSLIKKASQEELIELTKMTSKHHLGLVELVKDELQRRKDIGEIEIESLETAKSKSGLSDKQKEDLQKQIDLQKKLNRIQERELLGFDNKTEKERKALAKKKKFLAEQNEAILGDVDTFEDMPLMVLTEEDTKALEDYKSNTQTLIDENEKRKESIKDMADTVSNGLTVLNNVIQKKSQQRVEAFDREIQASQNAQEVLRTIAQQGVSDSEENLAFEQQKQAELEQRKQKEIERAANLELVLSAVSTFNAQVQAGATPAEALGSTAVTMTALEALVSGLDLFYEGTENTGTAANPLDSNGGRLAVLHDNERVMTSAQNDVIGNMTNWELANMAGDYRQGSLGMQNAMVVQPFMGGQEILNKFDELKDSIENKPVLTSINYNDQERAMVETVESRNKLIRNHRKTGGIW